MKLLEVSSLIDLATSQCGLHSNIQLSSRVLFKVLGVVQNVQRGFVPDAIAMDAAVAVLQLYDIPPEVRLNDVAMALAPPVRVACRTVQQQQQQQHEAWLDSLVGLMCLLSAGETADKLRLCYWTLDRSSSNSLSLEELLALLPALPPAAAAARLILKQATPQSLAAERADPAAQAAVQQRMHMLSSVLQRAFVEADPQRTGVLKPGEQFKQLLFSVAAALTAIIIGAVPAPGMTLSDASDAEDAAEQSESGSAGFVSAMGSMTAGTAAAHESFWEGQGSGASMSPGASSRDSSSRQQRDTEHPASSPHSSLMGARGASPHLPDDPFSQAPTAPDRQQQVKGEEKQPLQQTGLDTSSVIQPGQSVLNPAPADVLIVDPTGDILHYSCSVEEAAAAAALGKPPASMAGAGVHVYPQALTAVQGQAQPLAPEGSLSRRLSALGDAQQSLQQMNSLATATPQFLTPLNLSAHTGDAEDLGPNTLNTDSSGMGEVAVAPLPAGKQRYADAAVAAAVASRRFINKLKRRSTDDVGGPAGEIQQAIDAGTVAAVPAGAGAITTTAGTVLQSFQSNLAAASVRVLSYCGLCFLLTTLVVLGDAALVAGLHVGASMSLSVAFGITVGANVVLMLLLITVLVLVHARNARNNKTLADKLNSPQAQQLDQVLVNLTEALAALKKQEAQHIANKAGTGTVTGTSSLRRLTSVYTPEGGASNRDFDSQPRQPLPGLGFLGKLQPLWAAVGRIAGFQQQGSLPQTDSQSLQYQGSYEGGHTTLAVVTEDGAGRPEPSGAVALALGSSSSNAGDGALPAAASPSAVRPAGAYQQSRVVRVKGTAAPSGHPSNVGSAAGGISVREAYPL